jgi:hypothetical protein
MTLAPEPPVCDCPTRAPKTFTATTTSNASGKTKQEALDAARKVADNENDLELARVVCEGEDCELKPDTDPNIDLGTPIYEDITDGKGKVIGYRCKCTRSETGRFTCKKKSAPGGSVSVPEPLDLEELIGDPPEDNEIIAYAPAGSTSLHVRKGKQKIATKAITDLGDAAKKLRDLKMLEAKGDPGAEEDEPKLGATRIVENHKCGHRFPGSTGICRKVGDNTWVRVDRRPFARCRIAPESTCIEVYQTRATMRIYTDECNTQVAEVPIYGWSCLILV